MPKTANSIPPLLRWAGSKRKVLHRLRPFWSDKFARYIEPFAGSAVLFFDVQPLSALLGDINPHLINALRCVRDDPVGIYARLSPWRRSKCRFYRLRRQSAETLDPMGQAARFIYLNRFCFNGIYRTNARGEFNVPYAKSDTGRLPTLESLQKCSTALQRAEILRSDFESLVLEHAGLNDFVYMDPPYATQTRRIFREYEGNSFSVDDIPRLADLLRELERRKAFFLLSYAYCREALNAFSEWSICEFNVQRNVAGFSSSRRTAIEMLVSNLSPSLT